MNRKSYFLFSGLMVLTLVVANQSVFGLFSASASSLNNTFTAAAIFPSPSSTASPLPSGSPSSSSSPSPIPSGSVSPSSSPTPVPSGTPGSGVNINISGNGAGSNNTVNVNNSTDCIISQSNNTTVSNNITYNNNSGGNSILGTTSTTTSTTNSVQTGESFSNVTVIVNGGTNTSSGCP